MVAAAAGLCVPISRSETDGLAGSFHRRRRRRRRAVRPGRRHRRPARRRDRRQPDRSKRCSRSASTPARTQGAAAARSRRDGLDRRRADPARLWPRAAAGPGDLGDRTRREGQDPHRNVRRRRRRRQGRRAGRTGNHHDAHLLLLRQFRGRPVRRADRRIWGASGPTASRSICRGSTSASIPAARTRPPIR